MKTIQFFIFETPMGRKCAITTIVASVAAIILYFVGALTLTWIFLALIALCFLVTGGVCCLFYMIARADNDESEEDDFEN